jgi:hypothetical protein
VFIWNALKRILVVGVRWIDLIHIHQRTKSKWTNRRGVAASKKNERILLKTTTTVTSCMMMTVSYSRVVAVVVSIFTVLYSSTTILLPELLLLPVTTWCLLPSAMRVCSHSSSATIKKNAHNNRTETKRLFLFGTTVRLLRDRTIVGKDSWQTTDLTDPRKEISSKNKNRIS